MATLLDRMRQAILTLNVAAERRGNVRLGRHAVALAARLFRGASEEVAERIESFERVARRVVAEAVAQGAWPRYMDVEFVRASPAPGGAP